MKLSLKMIAERLEHQVRILKFKDIYSTIRLDKPVFLTDETQLKANTLYISTAERLPDNLTYQDGCALIVPGDIFTDLRSCPALILINDKEDIFRVHNLVCQIFDLFQNWERSLKYTYVHYSRMKALETLLNASVEIFENPLVLSDISFEILASAFPGGSAKASADRQRRSSAAKAAADRQSNPSAVRRKDASVNEPVNAAEGKRDDISVIGLFEASANRQDKALADHPAFRSHRKSHEVYVAVDGSLPCRLMTRNIFSGQTLFYHLIIAEICRPFRETDYLLLEFLAG